MNIEFSRDLSRRNFLSLLGLVGVSAFVVPLAGCSSGGAATTSAATDDSSKDASTTAATVSDPTEDTPIVADEDSKEVRYLAEVNGVYFDQSTRHGVVYKGGSNGEKAILRGLGDEKEFYQALLDVGFTPGNNLTADDMKAASGEGKSVDGEKLEVTIKWDGQEEIPFIDVVNCTAGDYTPDFRFGGNLESAEKNNTGCVLCLDSCATGIVSDAYWPAGTTQNNVAMFSGKEDVLPADGTKVVVTFKRRETN